MSDKEYGPEEVMKALGYNSFQAFEPEEVAEFLREWSELEEMVVDLERVVNTTKRQKVTADQVFEHLAEDNTDMDVIELLEAAEKYSEGGWDEEPDIDGTGELEKPRIEDMMSVPGEMNIIPLNNDYLPESWFEGSGKEAWIQVHEDGFYNLEVKPLDKKEVAKLLEDVEKRQPSHSIHLANYGGIEFYVDSTDLIFFFENYDEVGGFDEEIYRIDTDFQDFALEFSIMPGKEETMYRAAIYTEDGHSYPVESMASIMDENVVEGIRTRLELYEMLEQTEESEQ